MRIITGYLKGRTFEAPHGHKTHPMSEKMRGAIFNLLGDITGLTLFDTFAGSGAVAFEAISRGAKSAVATDITREAYETMQRNVRMLNVEGQVKVVRANASGWSDNNLAARFDIVVSDPPYDDIQPALLQKLAIHVKNQGLYILSLPPSESIELDGFKPLAVKEYGDSTLHFHRKIV
jgi:16S rRNA (guanine966-N2)-methyltransferase